MKNFVRVILISSISFIVSTPYVQANEPGTSYDPIVSKSYVEQKFNEILNILDNQDSNLHMGISQELKEAIIEEILLKISGESNNISTGTFTPIMLNTGQILIGTDGTEIIFRSGNAISYSNIQEGIVNVTKGTNMDANQSLEANNLLIIPRNDGRGVLALEDSWFLVKGGYTIN